MSISLSLAATAFTFVGASGSDSTLASFDTGPSPLASIGVTRYEYVVSGATVASQYIVVPAGTMSMAENEPPLVARSMRKPVSPTVLSVQSISIHSGSSQLIAALATGAVPVIP